MERGSLPFGGYLRRFPTMRNAFWLSVVFCVVLAGCKSSNKTRRVDIADDDPLMGTGIESADVEAMEQFAKSLIAHPELTGPNVEGVPTVGHPRVGRQAVGACELPGTRTIAGAALVIGAGLLVWWRERRLAT